MAQSNTAQADPISWQSLAHSGKLSRALDKEDPATPWIKKLRVQNLEGGWRRHGCCGGNG